MADRFDVYAENILLLFELERVKAAFTYLEKMKARSLLDILSTDRIKIAEGISPELLQKKKETEFLIGRVNHLLAFSST